MGTNAVASHAWLMIALASAALLSLGGYGLAVYAQEVVASPDVVTSTETLLAALASIAVSVGAFLGVIAKWIRPFNAKLANGMEEGGKDLLLVNHYLLTLKEEVAKNKASYPIVKEALFEIFHATPEQKAAVEAIEKKYVAQARRIEDEVIRQREQIDAIAARIPHKTVSAEEVEAEKTL